LVGHYHPSIAADRLKTNTAYQEKTKEELLEIISGQKNQIDTLTEMLRIYRYRQFGNKSEKSSPDQISIFNEAALPKKPDVIIKADEEIHIAAHTRTKSPGRKPLPESLPREQRVYDLT
jgi:uncharacterized coiled-coil protein SlyX